MKVMMFYYIKKSEIDFDANLLKKFKKKKVTENAVKQISEKTCKQIRKLLCPTILKFSLSQIKK